jgi:sporulation protein YlmC with PRC-barrel domain
MTLRASQLMGAAVVDRQGAPLGKVSDLLIDDSPAASVAYALVELELAPAEGDRTVAVPWSVLRNGHEQRVVLDISVDALARLENVHRS